MATSPDHPYWLRNLPNALTVLRLAVVPVFIVLFFLEEQTTVTLGLLFMGAAFTDFFDGWIARRWNLMSQFGKFADPIADRLLNNSAVFLLCVYDGRMLGWEWIVVIARDILATYGIVRVARFASVEVSQWGKLGTALMLGGLAWTLTLPGSTWPLWFFWAGLVLSVLTLFHYLWTYRWIFGEDADEQARARGLARDVYSGAGNSAASVAVAAGNSRNEETGGSAS